MTASQIPGPAGAAQASPPADPGVTPDPRAATERTSPSLGADPARAGVGSCVCGHDLAPEFHLRACPRRSTVPAPPIGAIVADTRRYLQLALNVIAREPDLASLPDDRQERAELDWQVLGLAYLIETAVRIADDMTLPEKGSRPCGTGCATSSGSEQVTRG